MLIDKYKHLSTIHKLPENLWPLLVSEMLSREWSAQETDNQVKKVKTLIDLVPNWWALNLESLAYIAIDGQSKPTALQALGDAWREYQAALRSGDRLIKPMDFYRTDCDDN